jgi:hypothetical protein
VRGINVHAKQVVDGRERRQLERLCRYITRPPVAQQRPELLGCARLSDVLALMAAAQRSGPHADSH